jgi:single-strand DNA-binding protein
MDLFNLTISGRLGKDPSLKYTDQGMAICTFSMAHQASKDVTEWYRVTTFRQLAETCNTYLKSGSRVTLVVSKQETRIWQKDNGENEISRDLVANQVIFGDSAKKEEALTDDNSEDDPGF